MTGKDIVALPRDTDAEVAVPLVGGCGKAEDVSGGRGSFFSGGRAASLVAVAIIGVAVVFSLVATRSKPSPALGQALSRTRPGLGAAVCVLGQLARLEIESKVQNIIEPLSSSTTVDVFLSLETVDHGASRTADVAGARCRGSELDVDGVKEAFAPYFRDAVFGPHVDEHVSLERWPLLYKQHYLGLLGESAVTDASRKIHLANVVSETRHLKDCAELIQKSEESAGGKYDIVVKVRDNTIALRPVVPDKLLSIREVTLKHCNWWGGVHDSVMALPREYLEKSLGATYPAVLAVMNDPTVDPTLLYTSKSENAEQLMMYTLARNKVPFRERAFEIGDRDGDEYLPFVEGRCSSSTEPGGEGRWCIVSHCKDCWPSMPWTFNVTCEVAETGLEVLAPSSSKHDGDGTSFEQSLAEPDPERECLVPIFR